MATQFPEGPNYGHNIDRPVTSTPLSIQPDKWRLVQFALENANLLTQEEEYLPRSPLSELVDVMRYADGLIVPFSDGGTGSAIMSLLTREMLFAFQPGSETQIDRWAEEQKDDSAESEALLYTPALGFAAFFRAARLEAIMSEKSLPKLPEESMIVFLRECAQDMQHDETFGVFLEHRVANLSAAVPVEKYDEAVETYESMNKALDEVKNYAYQLAVTNIANSGDGIADDITPEEGYEEDLEFEVGDLVNLGFYYCWWLYNRYEHQQDSVAQFSQRAQLMFASAVYHTILRR